MDNFSWVIGKHSLRMGGEFRVNQFPHWAMNSPAASSSSTASSPTPSLRPGRRLPRSPVVTPARTSTGRHEQLHHRRGARFCRFHQPGMVNLYRRHLARDPAHHGYLGLRLEVMQPLLDKSGNEVNIQLNQSLPNVANVQDLSKHPVYVRTAAATSTTASRSATHLIGVHRTLERLLSAACLLSRP